jgi:hypothetical protein
MTIIFDESIDGFSSLCEDMTDKLGDIDWDVLSICQTIIY